MGTGTQNSALVRSLTNSTNRLYVSAAATASVQYNSIIVNGGTTFTITLLDAAEFGFGFLLVYCEANPTAVTVAVPDMTNPGNLTAALDHVLLFSDGRHWINVVEVST